MPSNNYESVFRSLCHHEAVLAILCTTCVIEGSPYNHAMNVIGIQACLDHGSTGETPITTYLEPSLACRRFCGVEVLWRFRRAFCSSIFPIL